MFLYNSRVAKLIKNLFVWLKKGKELNFIQAANIIQLNGILAKQISYLAPMYDTYVSAIIVVTDMAGGSEPVTSLP